MTREEWLLRGVELLKEHFFNKPPKVLPKKLAVSCGIPKGSSRAIGQCWDPSVASDGTTHIFICPSQDDPITVLGILLHELIHACVGIEEGHSGQFATMARSVGLKGKLTATFVGKDSKLHTVLSEISIKIGEYPHKAMVKSHKVKKKKNNKTTVLLQSSVQPEYKLRIKLSILEEHGAPTCPFGELMEEAS